MYLFHIIQYIHSFHSLFSLYLFHSFIFVSFMSIMSFIFSHSTNAVNSAQLFQFRFISFRLMSFNSFNSCPSFHECNLCFSTKSFHSCHVFMQYSAKIQPFGLPFIRSLVRSSVCSLVRPYNDLLFHSFMSLLLISFNHSLISMHVFRSRWPTYSLIRLVSLKCNSAELTSFFRVPSICFTRSSVHPYFL